MSLVFGTLFVCFFFFLLPFSFAMLRETKTKLENITVLRYRGKHRAFEVLAVPNKLGEYRRSSAAPIDSVLATRSIFADARMGRLAKKEDLLAEFGSLHEDNVLRMILMKGTEKGDRETRDSENSALGKSIREGVRRRLRTAEGRRLSDIQVEQLLKKVAYQPTHNKPVKAQVSEVAKKAVLLGYQRKRISVEVRSSSPDTLFEIEKSLQASGLQPGSAFSTEQHEGWVLVSLSDDLYGEMHRLAESHKWDIKELPDEETVGSENPETIQQEL